MQTLIKLATIAGAVVLAVWMLPVFFVLACIVLGLIGAFILYAVYCNWKAKKNGTDIFTQMRAGTENFRWPGENSGDSAADARQGGSTGKYTVVGIRRTVKVEDADVVEEVSRKRGDN